MLLLLQVFPPFEHYLSATAGIRGFPNGVKLLLRHEAIWMRLLSLYMTAHRRMGKEVEKL